MPNETYIPARSSYLNRIKCECGKEIILIPDVEAMSQAIEAHIWEHLQEEKNPRRAGFESNRLWNLLVAAAFAQAYEA